MSTMKGNMRRAIVSGALIALAAAGVARADTVSDKPGAILVFPKVIVDTSGVFGPPTDTEIQITNTSNSVIAAKCFLVNTTSHCSNSTDIACTVAGETDPTTHRCPSGEVCTPPVWRANDFKMTLTKRQPISWKVSEGLSTFPCDGITTFCPDNQSNRGSDGSPSSIVPAFEDPFIGEVKCVEVSPDDFLPTIGFNPANNAAGDLAGEATIVSRAIERSSTPVDARKYNGIALQSTTNNDRDLNLQIGPGSDGEYNGCPSVLIMDHFFDDAVVSTHGGSLNGPVETDLTVVPCTEDFDTNVPTTAVLQFLVFNEFEQRFSASTKVTCFREVQLSDIDTRPGVFGNAQSIFNVGVEGTLTGQTRIRPVEGATSANGVLGIAETFWESNGPEGRSTGALNLHWAGVNQSKGDQITLPNN